MTTQFDIIQKKVWDLALRIDAPMSLTAVFFSSPQNGKPHVEIHGDEFHYVFAERGTVFGVDKTHNLNTLLYWIFSSITSQMAQEYALHHRKYGQDTRRILFARQLDLMAKLSEHWHVKLQKEISTTLEKNPYVDMRG